MQLIQYFSVYHQIWSDLLRSTQNSLRSAYNPLRSAQTLAGFNEDMNKINERLGIKPTTLEIIHITRNLPLSQTDMSIIQIQLYL